MSPPKKQLPAGHLIDGRYEVVEYLDHGGRAVVYIVRHLQLDAEMALKLVHPDIVKNDPKLVEEFLNEARVTAKLDHPNIVPVTDAGFDAKLGQPFMVMSLLRGGTMRDHLNDQGPGRRRSLAWSAARPLIRDIANGLTAAHALGIVHRDIKPSNVFVLDAQHGTDERAVLVDFGIAKVLGPQVQTATAVGTPAYMAPEQLGKLVWEAAPKHGFIVAKGVSPQTDVFSFGLLVLEMLSGVGPAALWQATTSADFAVAVAFKPRPRLFQQLRELSGVVPPTFESWLDRALRHDAAERWASADEAFSALREIMDRFVPQVEVTVAQSPVTAVLETPITRNAAAVTTPPPTISDIPPNTTAVDAISTRTVDTHAAPVHTDPMELRVRAPSAADAKSRPESRLPWIGIAGLAAVAGIAGLVATAGGTSEGSSAGAAQSSDAAMSALPSPPNPSTSVELPVAAGQSASASASATASQALAMPAPPPVQSTNAVPPRQPPVVGSAPAPNAPAKPIKSADTPMF